MGQDTTSLRVILTVSLQLAMNSPKTTGGHDQNSLEESLNRRTWLFMGHGAEIAIARRSSIFGDEIPTMVPVSEFRLITYFIKSSFDIIDVQTVVERLV